MPRPNIFMAETILSIAALIIAFILGLKVLQNILYTAVLVIIIALVLWLGGFLI